MLNLTVNDRGEVTAAKLVEKDARRVMFYIDDQGRAISATVFTSDGTPVDGYTDIEAFTGLDYLINHPEAEIDTVRNP